MADPADPGEGPVRFRPTTPADLPFVVATETDPENARFVLQWTRRRHEESLLDPDVAHFIVEEAPGHRPCGYVILRGLAEPHRSIEFKRIALAVKGKGFGRAAVRIIKRTAFEKMGAHRLWLDVMTHNTRAHRLYLSEGFREEGTLRESAFVGGAWVSHILMSILEHEYRA